MEPDPQKKNFRIIVIGASAGGFDAIRSLISGLPEDFPAAIFIVWHIAPEIRGVLPQVLSRESKLPASNAYDGETIVPGRVYVAPPDRHLLIDSEQIRISRGPKENRFRPAVDPLFRSAAFAFGTRVISIILSGALDDGTAGTWSVKNRGGITIVQDPNDAQVRGMTESAINSVQIDYVVPVAEMPALLQELVTREAPEADLPIVQDNERTHEEIKIAMQKGLSGQPTILGDFSSLTCPECHGVLSKISEGSRTRYRCHTGHAFSADSLLVDLTESVGESIWNAIRGIEESVMLLNHMGDHLAESNRLKLAATYFQKAKEAGDRVLAMKKIVGQHEQLSADVLEDESTL